MTLVGETIGSAVGGAAVTVGAALLSAATVAVHSVASATAAATAPTPVVAAAPRSFAEAASASTDRAPADAAASLLHAEHLRAEAHALKVERDRHFAESQACFSRGDGAGAKAASDRRKQTQQRIELLRAQSAELLYAHHNAGRGLHELDLHGMYVEEALAQLQRRIDAVEKRLRTPATAAQPALAVPFMLVVIVGRGNHSRDRIAKLRPAVEKLIEQHRLRVHGDTPNAGCITIEFGSKEPIGWVGCMVESCAVM